MRKPRRIEHDDSPTLFDQILPPEPGSPHLCLRVSGGLPATKSGRTWSDDFGGVVLVFVQRPIQINDDPRSWRLYANGDDKVVYVHAARFTKREAFTHGFDVGFMLGQFHARDEAAKAAGKTDSPDDLV